MRPKAMALLGLAALGASTAVLFLLESAVLRSPTLPAGSHRAEPGFSDTGCEEEQSERRPVVAAGQDVADKTECVRSDPAQGSVPVRPENLPLSIRDDFTAAIERIRKCQRQHDTYWKAPDKFRVSPECAEALVREFKELDALVIDAEKEYRRTHMEFVDREVDSGRGVKCDESINDIIRRLKAGGVYDPERDHFGYTLRYGKGRYYVLTKGGQDIELDSRLSYTQEMVNVYTERCRSLLMYLVF